MQDLGLKTFDKLYPMLIKKYQDLIIDQNATEKDKINQIIVKLNALGKLSNDVVRDWNTVYKWVMNDGLVTDVNNKIEAMNASGELATLLHDIFISLTGDMTTLHTNAKDTTVNAINEIDDLAKQNQSDIATNTANIEANTADIATNTANIATNTANIASNAAQLTQIASQKTDWINITQAPYNADKTGVTDCATIIQSAIDYANSNGLHVIYFPTGTYKISGTLKVRANVILMGDGYLTEIKASTANNMIELYDDTAVFCKVIGMTLNGNSIAPLGIYLTRSITTVGWDITRFYALSLQIKNCTSHGFQIGTASDKSTMEITGEDLFLYNNGGYGIYLLHATDSVFKTVYARENKQGGIYARSTNTKYSNVKSYANGHSAASPAPGFYITGTMNTFENCEAQENTADGYQIDSATACILTNIVADKNGMALDLSIPVTPTYNGIKINNSNNILIDAMLTDSGFTNYGQYTQKYGIYLDTQCKNVTINYGTKDLMNEIYSNSTTNNDIKLNKAGIESLTFSSLPATATANGITFTKVSEQLLSLNGTATANAQCQMYGAFGDPTYNKITFKAGQKIKVSLANKAITGVTFYMVINSSTVAVATNWDTLYIPTADGYINNVYIQVTNGTVLSNVLVKPQIIISD
jgi:hypothetical protein